MYDGLERLAEASGAGAGVGNLIVLALVLERFLAGENLPDDRNIFFRARERLAIGDAVPALDHLRAGRADAEKKASARKRLQAHGGHRRAGRRACLHLHDAGAALDLRRARQQPRHRGDGVAAPGFAGPGGIEAEALGLQHEIEVEARRGPRGPQHDAELHRSPPLCSVGCHRPRKPTIIRLRRVP